MAFLFGDSFDHYATADILSKWTGKGGTGPTIGAYGRNSTNGVRITNDVPSLYKTVTASSTIIVGGAFQIVGARSANPFLSLQYGSDVHLRIGMNSSGQLTLSRIGPNSWDVTILETSSFIPTVGAYYFLEIKALIANSGTWIVRINGVNIMAGSGDTYRDALPASVNTVALSSISTGAGEIVYWDDFYVCDTTGSYNNDFLGDIRGMTQFANADGTYTDFTASAGSRFACVNKITPTADATYIKSLTAAHKGTFTFPALGATGSVACVETNVYGLKSDAGTRIVKPICKSGVSESAGAEYSLSDSGVYIPSYIQEVDPATSAAWLVAGVDAAEQGVQLVS